jgi:hypothetical protein
MSSSSTNLDEQSVDSQLNNCDSLLTACVEASNVTRSALRSYLNGTGTEADHAKAVLAEKSKWAIYNDTLHNAKSQFATLVKSDGTAPKW